MPLFSWLINHFVADIPVSGHGNSCVLGVLWPARPTGSQDAHDESLLIDLMTWMVDILLRIGRVLLL